jgi:predicted branched-subunit amino acid permease
MVVAMTDDSFAPVAIDARQRESHREAVLFAGALVLWALGIVLGAWVGGRLV